MNSYWDDEEENQFIKNSFSGVNMQQTLGSMYGFNRIRATTFGRRTLHANQCSAEKPDKSLKDQLQFISRCLPDFVPITQNQSTIIDEAGIRLITIFLPPLIRMREWKLLFSIDIHGRSMRTFYNQVRDWDNTCILIENDQYEVFGTFQVEEWHDHSAFYGSGDGSFIFDFNLVERKRKSIEEKKQMMVENINVYDPLLSNNRY